MDNTEQTIISIATGFGGLEAGLEQAGINLRVAAYVEVEAFIIANLVAAMETNQVGAAPIWADIKTFPSEKFHRKVHGITAGYPCQPFSNAGKRKGTTDERHIFPHILRSVEAIRPVWCYFENVEGHLSMGYDEVYRSLRAIGYKVEAGIFSANEVGAPHERQRLYILAIKMEYTNAATLQRIFFGDATAFSNIGGASKMAYSNSQRNGKRKQRNESGVFDLNGFKWPVGRGQQQQSWEHPRTAESFVGCSADGYNFRTDILRALGNGVVQQTAAKAFVSLLSKFK